MPVVERAHRRHEPDRLAPAPRRLERGAELGRRCGRPGARSWTRPCPARGSGRRAPRRGAAAREPARRDRLEVARDRFLVAAGDRPGEGVARRSRPSWRRFEGRAAQAPRARSRRRRTPSAAPRTPPARPGSWRPSRLRRGRRRGLPPGPRTGASRAARRARGPSPPAAGLDAAMAHGAPARSVCAVRDRLQRVEREGLATRVGCGAQRVQPRCAADVADEGAGLERRRPRLRRPRGSRRPGRTESTIEPRLPSWTLAGSDVRRRCPRRAPRARSSRRRALRPPRRGDPRARAQTRWWRRCGRVPVLARENPDGWCGWYGSCVLVRSPRLEGRGSPQV